MIEKYINNLRVELLKEFYIKHDIFIDFFGEKKDFTCNIVFSDNHPSLLGVYIDPATEREGQLPDLSGQTPRVPGQMAGK